MNGPKVNNGVAHARCWGRGRRGRRRAGSGGLGGGDGGGEGGSGGLGGGELKEGNDDKMLTVGISLTVVVCDWPTSVTRSTAPRAATAIWSTA